MKIIGLPISQFIYSTLGVMWFAIQFVSLNSFGLFMAMFFLTALLLVLAFVEGSDS